jgi:hypothetical protein
VDLQDPTLKLFNTELLEFSGILMRLSLEHAMGLIDEEWKVNAPAREKLEKELEAEAKKRKDQLAEVNAPPEQAGQEEEEDSGEADESSGIFSFAKFMAKGITKGFKKVVETVEQALDNGSEYLHPKDPRPLSLEEKNAIVLMQSFCPEQSTPDPGVGIAVATGFSRCMPGMNPPVLTRSGVVRGDQARLPNHGMENFVDENVIRGIVYKNCEEYHNVIARSRPLKLEDVVNYISTDVIERHRLVYFLNWFTRYSHVDPYSTRSLGERIKDKIRFYRDDPPIGDSAKHEEREIACLGDLLFYVEREGLLSDTMLPMPGTVLPTSLQEQIGDRTLTDSSLSTWFSPIPIEIWLEFVSHHRCIMAGIPEDDVMRLKVLTVFHKSYERRPLTERAVFGDFCRRLLSDKRCIPFDSDEPTGQYSADLPSSLYLFSAELKAFENIGTFRKVSRSLSAVGISEEWLLQLGCLKSIAVDLLFTNLDTLKWSEDPKPLVEYLRTATLTKKDIHMLKSSKYLPAENDKTRSFAPSELFLPDPELKLFPFLRILQWPAEDLLPAEEKFLLLLGMHKFPALETILSYTSEKVKDNDERIRILNALSKRMGVGGVYHQEWARLRPSRKADFKIIPAVRQKFLQNSSQQEIHSPTSCFSDTNCSIMCYPVIDSSLGEAELYATIFHLPKQPPPDSVLEQLLVLVQLAKRMLSTVEGGKNLEELSARVFKTFADIFKYLSSRTSDFNSSSLSSLRSVNFIPVHTDTYHLQWCRPDQVFFKTNSRGSGGDSLLDTLFTMRIEFSSFLSAIGVTEDPSTKDMFIRIHSDPESVLKTLGSEKYRILLRRKWFVLLLSIVEMKMQNVINKAMNSEGLFTSSRPCI